MMKPNFYEQISISMFDAILASLRAQPVPLNNMAAHYRVVEMFEEMRWAKAAEQARREGTARTVPAVQ